MCVLSSSWRTVFEEATAAYLAGGNSLDVNIDDEGIFRGIVLFALYYVDVFRISLKNRLNALCGSADAMLKLMVGRYWAGVMKKKEVSPRSRTPMSIFGGGYF